jgi:hypothetical protein
MVAGVATPVQTPESAISADVVSAADCTGHVIRANTGEPLEVNF